MIAEDDVQAVQQLNEACQRITSELAKVIVGQQQVIEELLIALFARGHCLLVGVPGLAKTLMIRSLADALTLHFNRIQFTPDLMPSDITGTDVMQEDKATGTREFRFVPGPMFANIVLADEINRTPPKTQAALLEAMQEHQVTVGGKRHTLVRAVLRAGHAEPDRAGRHVSAARSAARPVHVPGAGRLSRARTRNWRSCGGRPRSIRGEVAPALDAEQILALTRIVRRVPVADHTARYALRLARLTRPQPGRDARIRARLRDVGRRPARQPVHGAGRQGPRRAAGADLCQRRRHSRRALPPCCGTASRPTSTPTPKASRPTRSCAA